MQGDELEHPPAAAGTAELTEEEIDEIVEGTFPASDPPCWTLGTDRREQAEDEASAEGSAAGES